ncbi:mitochondrial ribosomal protein MRP51 [Pseudoneurospora amorphoporcata]|uniref:Mitochondrial ribosomal protein MRP51 n=1 Tax=Pseudoneurospora amorphoporcata TaxID=241081 RepID=A0AAN6NWZ1_9PEZI|nr:mitochondrial ribosomal protein MRP51 [Pseudoneurospora amorphoporcata]
MASSRSLSPGGALLRTSRMFSLPQPIPPPPSNKLSLFNDKPPTEAYPTQQVLTTFESSRSRGDWGLKRPLPLRLTTTSTYGMVKVKEMDSIEAITDFSSGTQHGLTLKKFQALNIPISTPSEISDPSRLFRPVQRSVFEADTDVTAFSPDEQIQEAEKRWKFSGPWLAGMTPGEFKEYLAKTVRPKRNEFRKFIQNKLAAQKTEAANRELQETAALRGDAVAETQEPFKPESISDEEVTEYLRRLRNDNQVLYDLVGQFLDLAPLKPPQAAEARHQNPLIISLRATDSPYGGRGPPITHPSAGISYLRTAAYLDNHPIYGPQKSHPPVQARVLKPRRGGLGQDAKVGVAGFVADGPLGTGHSNMKGNTITEKFDPSIEGGAKLWVNVEKATVDSTGRVQLTVNDAKATDILIAKELIGETDEPIFGSSPKRQEKQFKRVTMTAARIRKKYEDSDSPSSPPTMSGSSGYGFP